MSDIDHCPECIERVNREVENAQHELLFEARQALLDLPATLTAPNPEAALSAAIGAIDYRLNLITPRADAQAERPPDAKPIRRLESALKDRATTDGEVVSLMNLLGDALHEARHQTCACGRSEMCECGHAVHEFSCPGTGSRVDPCHCWRGQYRPSREEATQ